MWLREEAPVWHGCGLGLNLGIPDSPNRHWKKQVRVLGGEDSQGKGYKDDSATLMSDGGADGLSREVGDRHRGALGLFRASYVGRFLRPGIL